MPQRFLRPGITHSERWNAVGWAEQSLFIRILTLVDDFGRCDGREPVIWAQCYAVWNHLHPLPTPAAKRSNSQQFAVTLQQLEQMLQQLAAKELIDIYDDAETGKRVLQVLQWQERVREGCKPKWPARQNAAANGCNSPESCSDLQQLPQKLLPPSPSPTPTPSPTPPPTVPQRGTGERDSAHPILQQTSPSEREALILAAKKRTCGLGTFRGPDGRPKDHTRAWSRDAMDYLTQHLPVPEEEWRAVEWFHGLAPDDTIQELKNRRQSETTLWQFWQDEVTRAHAYRRKVKGIVHGGVNGALSEKKEPARWREFFRWKYGPEVRLTPTFAALPRDQREEWEREHEEFDRAVAAEPQEASA